jgi:hypothetical protein
LISWGPLTVKGHFFYGVGHSVTQLAGQSVGYLVSYGFHDKNF